MSLANVGGSALDVTSTTISGDDGFIDDFGADPISLAVGEELLLTIRFAPGTTRAFTAELSVSHSGNGGPSLITLTGTGIEGPDDDREDVRAIAFSAAPAGCAATCAEESALWLSADGEIEQLTDPGPSADRFPRWSPDGSALAFTRIDRTSGRGEIHLLAVDGDGFSMIGRVTYTSDAHGSLGCDGEAMIPTWSPTGTRLAFTCAAGYGRSSVHVVNADGAIQFQLPQEPGIADASPTWSPDGGRMAFERLDTGVPYGKPDRVAIWTAKVGPTAAASLLPLVGGTTAAGSPAWAPGGERIVYVETDEITFDTRLNSVDPNTATTTNHLTVSGSTGDSIYGVSWSPDSESVAFLLGDGGRTSTLKVLQIRSGKVTQVSSSEPLAFAPSWSDDGSSLLFDQFDPTGGAAHQRVVTAAPDGSSSSFLTPPELHAYDGRRRLLP